MSLGKQVLGGLRLESTPGQANIREVREVLALTAAVDPPNQTGATFFGMDVTVTGVRVGDICIGVIPPSELEANLRPVGAVVRAADSVRLTLQALAAVDGASRSWTFIIIR